jgi:2-polyprenylphenol hydroxylase and related flavodoxin oxidoreductases
MMQRHLLTVAGNRTIAQGIYEMKLEGCTTRCLAGQFVNLEIEGCYLRRPISVCDWEDGVLTLAYKVVGKGTEIMAGLQPGARIDTLVALGNGFDADVQCSEPLLVGGGIGLAPLYLLARNLIARGRKVKVVAGFRSSGEIFNEERFRSLGAEFVVATEDGSSGTKGFVTDAIRQNGLTFDYIYACGPMPMMKALCGSTDVPGEMSLEERMGCGFGICMGCTCKTSTGGKRVCKDGPVFKREEIVW